MNDKTDNALFQNFDIIHKDILTIRSEVIKNTCSFFNEQGYMLIDPPILHEHIANRKKGISVALYNNYYDLNASNALYISVYATIYGSVFAISPTFRQEKQSDNHLIEFRMLECESTNINFQQCIEITKKYIQFILDTMQKYCIGTVFENRLELLNSHLVFETITYRELILQLQEVGNPIKYGDDLSNCDLEVSRLLKALTFVVDYPNPPATWTALPKDDATYTFNLLLPDGFGELAEGGQRNNDYTVFQDKFRKAGLDSLSWYAEAIKRNPCPRSGFGLGIERLIGWLIGNKAIRETVLFHREGV